MIRQKGTTNGFHFGATSIGRRTPPPFVVQIGRNFWYGTTSLGTARRKARLTGAGGFWRVKQP